MALMNAISDVLNPHLRPLRYLASSPLGASEQPSCRGNRHKFAVVPASSEVKKRAIDNSLYFSLTNEEKLEPEAAKPHEGESAEDAAARTLSVCIYCGADAMLRESGHGASSTPYVDDAGVAHSALVNHVANACTGCHSGMEWRRPQNCRRCCVSDSATQAVDDSNAPGCSCWSHLSADLKELVEANPMTTDVNCRAVFSCCGTPSVVIGRLRNVQTHIHSTCSEICLGDGELSASGRNFGPGGNEWETSGMGVEDNEEMVEGLRSRSRGGIDRSCAARTLAASSVRIVLSGRSAREIAQLFTRDASRLFRQPLPPANARR